MTLNISTYAMSGVDESTSFLGGLSTTENNIFVSSGTCATALAVTSSTTFANVPNLTVNVLAGATYNIKARLAITSTVNGGAKISLGGTCTLSGVNVAGSSWNAATLNTRNSITATTLGTTIVGATAVTTDLIIDGSLQVLTSGTLTIQFAQNASHVDTSTALVFSSFDTIRTS